MFVTTLSTSPSNISYAVHFFFTTYAPLHKQRTHCFCFTPKIYCSAKFSWFISWNNAISQNFPFLSYSRAKFTLLFHCADTRQSISLGIRTIILKYLCAYCLLHGFFVSWISRCHCCCWMVLLLMTDNPKYCSRSRLNKIILLSEMSCGEKASWILKFAIRVSC